MRKAKKFFNFFYDCGGYNQFLGAVIILVIFFIVESCKPDLDEDPEQSLSQSSHTITQE